ncbi:hypothetical protein HZA97_04875 [Candidatus Woesearchaeota archaeon]|nr:hypothetical protein [Candidatus Woesearchaeota archaeon]
MAKKTFLELIGLMRVKREYGCVNIKRAVITKGIGLHATYYPAQGGALEIQEYSPSKGSIEYMDENNDGKVEKITTILNNDSGSKEYTRDDAKYASAFEKADKKFSKYKRMLNVDKIVPRELKIAEQGLEGLVDEV